MSIESLSVFDIEVFKEAVIKVTLLPDWIVDVCTAI